MDLSIITTPIGLITLVTLVVILIVAAQWLPLQGISLPCVTVMTSLIYFFLMPVIVISTGDLGYFGIYLQSLEWAHFAVFLYVIGAAAAFFFQWKALTTDPGVQKTHERVMSVRIFYSLWGLVVVGILAQVAMGKLNLTGAENYDLAVDKINELAFITEIFNMMVPLTLLVLLRDDFKWRSLLFSLIVIFVFLQVGFRFRIMIMLAAAVGCYAIVHHIKIKIAYTIFGGMAAILLSNAIGSLRSYGRGIDFAAIDTSVLRDKATSLDGEVGVAYVLADFAQRALPSPVYFEPWVVGVARLVPSFIWHDKPTADYLGAAIAGVYSDASGAGVAASQQVEMLLQFGWIGLPFLAFLYFSGAGYLIKRFNRLGREARIVGCALVPAYFGFYMQTRGYFFQFFADSLFFFGPLFLVHIWQSPGKEPLPSKVNKGQMMSMSGHSTPVARRSRL